MDLAEIDRVIERLDEIIDSAIADESKIAFFAAMYRKVTASVRDAIIEEKFVDNKRMVHFDYVFAERFIVAFETWQSGRRPSLSWQAAFDALNSRHLVILQHLLIGMNAHIRLDLGIAAAKVAPREEIGSLRADFDQINEVLGALTAHFESDLGALSPWIGWVDRVGGRDEDELIRFGLTAARDDAWNFALELAPLSDVDQARPIANRDRETAALSKAIRRPGLLLAGPLFVIRARENQDVATVAAQLRV